MKQQFYFFFLLSFFFVAKSAYAESVGVTDSIKGTSCISIEQKTPLIVSVDKQDSSVIRSIKFRNLQWIRVNYAISMEYIRFSEARLPEKKSLSPVNLHDLLFLQLENLSSDRLKSSDSTINIIQYESEASLSFAFGVQNSSGPLSLATKFKAGPDGLNLSSVGTWFIGDYLSTGTIKTEIRAGGTSINNAVTLATGTLDFEIGREAENGCMYSIPLNQDATIYPNEDFYLILTYPEKSIRPQGCAMNDFIETTPGRYWAMLNGEWVDIQTVTGYSKCAWLMNVTEMEKKSNTWLNITSDLSGTLWGGRTSQIDLLFEGEKTSPGIHMANLFLSVDDTCRTKITIPVTFHINEAPYFTDAPSEVFVNENEQLELIVGVTDHENDECVIIPVEGAKIVSYSFSESKLTLKIAPLSGDAGTYKVRFRVMDTKGASDEFELMVHVASITNYLDYLFDEKWFTFSYVEKNLEYNVHELFRYKNGDDFIFNVTSMDEEVFSVVQQNDSIFSIIPNTIGESSLYFIVTNTSGKNKSTFHIPVKIGLCKDASFIIKQKWNKILFVDNLNGEFAAEGYQWYKNNEIIENATKQFYSAGDSPEDLLDINSVYHVRLLTTNGDTIYTCPVKPVFQEKSTVRIYPNPVGKNEMLNISTDYPNPEAEMRVKMYDFSGRLIKAGSFVGQQGEFIIPSVTKGFYIIQLSNGVDEHIQNLFIK